MASARFVYCVVNRAVIDEATVVRHRCHNERCVRPERCCQTDSNQSQFPNNRGNLGRTELAPLGQSGVADQLEDFAGIEVALLVEMV